jgi:anti-sigma factor RsiW
VSCDVTCEELAAFAAGDLPEACADEIGRHLADCPRCRSCRRALARSDAILAGLRRWRPDAGALLRVRRALSAATRARGSPEVMTLSEVAEHLQITPEQLDEIVEELPAFELAGQVRVRRTRLIQWIERREHEYARRAAARWAAGGLSDGPPTGDAR